MPPALSSKTKPLVSVVIPAYNCASYIEATIQSVFAQDYPNIEIIIVDDGSSDDTIHYLSRFQERRPDKVRIFEQSNAGSAVARNRGIAEAKGELVAFLDADDIWFPEKISAQVAFLKSHPDIGIVYCGWREWYPGENPESVVPTQQPVFSPAAIEPEHSGWLYPLLLTDCIVWTSTVLARRSLLEKVGEFDSTFRRGQDYDYWLRASQITPIVKLAKVMAVYRITDQSITRQNHPINYGYEVLKKNLARWGRRSVDGRELPLSALRKRLFDIWYHFAVIQYQYETYGSAIISVIRALRHQPFALQGWAILAESAMRYPAAALRRRQ